MTITKDKFLLLWFPVILYAGLIFYLSSLSQPPTPYLFPQQDKIIHTIEYAIFGWLLARAIKNTYKLSGFNFFLVVILLTFLYGLSDEFHQMFVPMRRPEMLDAMADGLGGVLGCWVYRKNIR